MVWAIVTSAGISKGTGEYRISVQTIRNRLDMKAWSAYVATDFYQWSGSAR